jgi:hypothetical protein
MKYHPRLIPVALVAAWLAGCGGGGGSSDTPAATQGSVALSGVAAKGPMVNADVGAYAVNADGTVSSTAITTSTTDSVGHYALSFSATQNQPYVIKVSAKADGSTTHVDEVTQAVQVLPAGFTLRALLVPTTSGALTTTASITPFSELAVAAAARASGGITKANADQAASTVAQLLGFDPLKIAVKAAGAAGNSEDEKKLAILLTAVSKLAGGGAFNCTAGAAGDKVKCVVEALGNAASTGSIKLDAGGTNVSAALGGAVAAVLADNTLNGGVAPSTLGGVTANLACTTNCAAATVATVSAITSAKALFTQLRSDWQALFSQGGASSIATGAANQEAWKFRQAMSGVQVPAETMIEDMGMLLMAVDLYNDYKAGRTTINNRGRAAGEVASSTPAALGNYTAVGCTLFKELDANGAAITPATTPLEANYIGCRASYYTTIVGTTTVDWRHAFLVTPNGGGSFGYGTRARKRTVVNGVTNENLALQASGYSGTVTTTTDALGHVIGFTATGELPATFEQGGTALINDHNSWNLSGTRTITGAHTETVSITGSLVSYSSATAVAGTLAVKAGTLTQIEVGLNAFGNSVRPGSATDTGFRSGEIGYGTLDLAWTTPTAEFEGVLSSTPSVWDLSGRNRSPGSVALSGALRTLDAGVTTEFLKGNLKATVTGYAAFNEQLPASAGNDYTTAMEFTGSVTAPTRPVLELTLSASKKASETMVGSVNMQYSALVGGTPRTVIAVTGTRGAGGALSFTLSEATAGLSVAWSEGATQASLLKGSDVIGVFDKSSQLITFSDRSVMSLDFGL